MFRKGMHKKSIKWLSALAIVLLSAMCFCACSWQSSVSVHPEKLDFFSMSTEELSELVEIGEYKNLQISLNGRTREEAVWDAIIAGSTVKDYPEEHVYYYIGQFQGQYKYYAEEAGMSYEKMLNELGINEGTIQREATEMTQKDILYALIVKLEGIELTEEEKTSLFDKYVEIYVSEYGYSNEYVTENMSELIYGSMLYDKTTEFLIVNNTIN